jgi:hypothetical protein
MMKQRYFIREAENDKALWNRHSMIRCRRLGITKQFMGKGVRKLSATISQIQSGLYLW